MYCRIRVEWRANGSEVEPAEIPGVSTGSTGSTGV